MKVSENPLCNGCPLQKLFPDNPFVPLQLGTSTRLAIGEAPGSDEAIAGQPFVGASGRWLEGLYRKANVRKEDLTIINTIQCRPPNNVFPTDPDARSYISEEDAKRAVAHCVDAHVRPVLGGHDWTRVDIFGDKALRFVAGKDGGIFQWRGSPISVPGLGHSKPIAIPTLHPAYLVRDQSMIPVVLNDLKKNAGLLPPENYDLAPGLDVVQAFDAPDFAFDLESVPGTDRITMDGLCARPTHVIVVPFQGAYVPELKRIFNAAKVLYGQNLIAFDLPMLAANGIEVSNECQVWDLMLMQHLLFPDLPHDLEFIASQFCLKPCWKHEGKGEPWYWQVRNARDVDVTLQCGKYLVPKLKSEKLADLYNYVQWPLARICRLMYDTGFKVDPNRIHIVRERLLTEMADEETLLPEALRTHTVKVNKREKALGDLWSLKTHKPIKFFQVEADETVVPWRSTQAVQTYLYETLGLAKQLHVKSGRITSDKTALEKLYRRTKRREILAVLKLRKKDELITTFCKETMQAVSRMHPHFNVHGTNSGRLSSSDPNCQNIPEAARVIYVPSHSDWTLVECDYSQGENRLVAHFAGDTERLARLAQPGFSEHKHNAGVFFGIPYDEVEKDNDKDAPYGKAKRITHGVGYGMGALKIAKLYDLDTREVKDLLGKWKVANPLTVRWQEEIGKKAHDDGVLVNPFGRKRWFYTNSFYTEALSFLPQSTLADIIFRSMIALMYERINWPVEKVLKVARVIKALPKPARLLLQVHDSLVVETPRNIVDEVVYTLKTVMEQPWPELGGMHIPVEVKTGDSWGECVPYHEPQVRELEAA